MIALIQAGQELRGDSRTVVRRKLQCLFEESGGVPRHGMIVAAMLSRRYIEAPCDLGVRKRETAPLTQG